MAMKAQASSVLLQWVTEFKREHGGKLPSKGDLPAHLGASLLTTLFDESLTAVAVLLLTTPV
jgi:hypothetical protein